MKYDWARDSRRPAYAAFLLIKIFDFPPLPSLLLQNPEGRVRWLMDTIFILKIIFK